MIRSYGLHWHIDKVIWTGKKRGLFGAASRSGRAKRVDFSGQRGIYALYADYDVVYVGQAGTGDDRLFDRLRTHTVDHLSERWNRFSWFGTQWVKADSTLSADKATLSNSVEAALNVLEAVSIAVSEPRLNLQRGKWGDATKYFQYVEKEVEDGEE